MTCQCGWYRGNLLESRPGAYAPGHFYCIGYFLEFLIKRDSCCIENQEREEAVWLIKSVMKQSNM